MGLCALLQCQNKPPCLGEPSIQGQLMGDFIHLFTGLQKAIQVRDEDDDDEESDEGKLVCLIRNSGRFLLMGIAVSLEMMIV